MRASIVGIICTLAATPALAAETLWVTADRLNRRTCPATHCGSVGWLMHREKATVYERRGGWGRISKHYYASCRNGKSEFVKTGDARCSADNGINNGKFAEWVSLKHLTKTRPADPGANAAGLEKLVSGSDDYRKHKSVFVDAARKLIASGRCTAEDFKEMGGWVKSTTTYRNKPVYFTYCGGMTVSNRLYLNAVTGDVFQ